MYFCLFVLLLVQLSIADKNKNPNLFLLKQAIDNVKATVVDFVKVKRELSINGGGGGGFDRSFKLLK